MNLFADDWHDCLREQYMHVIRQDDHITLNTLTGVMHQVGFSDTELAELRVQATMHVDDVGADFVPDLDILEPTVYAGVDVEDEPDDTPPTYAEALEEAAQESESEPEDEPPAEPDAPQQLSLF